MSQFTVKRVNSNEGDLLGWDVINEKGLAIDFFDHHSQAKERADKLNAESRRAMLDCVTRGSEPASDGEPASDEDCRLDILREIRKQAERRMEEKAKGARKPMKRFIVTREKYERYGCGGEITTELHHAESFEALCNKLCDFNEIKRRSNEIKRRRGRGWMTEPIPEDTAVEYLKNTMGDGADYYIIKELVDDGSALTGNLFDE